MSAIGRTFPGLLPEIHFAPIDNVPESAVDCPLCSARPTSVPFHTIGIGFYLVRGHGDSKIAQVLRCLECRGVLGTHP